MSLQYPASVRFLIRERAGQFTGYAGAVFTAAGIRIRRGAGNGSDLRTG